MIIRLFWNKLLQINKNNLAKKQFFESNNIIIEKIN